MTNTRNGHDGCGAVGIGGDTGICPGVGDGCLGPSVNIRKIPRHSSYLLTFSA